VIKQIAPDVDVIDVTHGIPPQAVLQGALVLANTIPYMPRGVHLAVVDPGVGTARRALALKDVSDGLYVGPDNGLLVPAAEKRGGIVAAHELTNAEFALTPVSRTFHGRDVFAPAAAHLAAGVALERFGPPLDVDSLVRLDVPEPKLGGRTVHATVLYVDRYGNVQLNLVSEHLDRVGISPGTRVSLEIGARRWKARAARTFGDARTGDVILYEDAYRNVAVAVTGGDAAATLAVSPGEAVVIEGIA
jgi:S-adenosylmethionine hydrolase